MSWDEASSARSSTLGAQDRAYQRQLASRLAVIANNGNNGNITSNSSQSRSRRPQQSAIASDSSTTTTSGSSSTSQQQRSYQSIRQDLLSLYEGSSGTAATESSTKRSSSVSRRQKGSSKNTEANPNLAPHHLAPVHEGYPTQALTKDYIKLAQRYKSQENYRSSANPPKSSSICLLCHESCIIERVFWPCAHQCVCNSCIMTHRMGSARFGSSPAASNVCPLCKDGIKIVLKSRGGNERQQFEAWMNDVRPTISRTFAREFKARSAMEIRWAMRESQQQPDRWRHSVQTSEGGSKHKARKQRKILPASLGEASSNDDDDDDGSHAHGGGRQYRYQWKGPCVIQ